MSRGIDSSKTNCFALLLIGSTLRRELAEQNTHHRSSFIRVDQAIFSFHAPIKDRLNKRKVTAPLSISTELGIERKQKCSLIQEKFNEKKNSGNGFPVFRRGRLRLRWSTERGRGATVSDGETDERSTTSRA